MNGICGADNRIRTGDLVLTKDVLYLLSHISNYTGVRQLAAEHRVLYTIVYKIASVFYIYFIFAAFRRKERIL